MLTGAIEGPSGGSRAAAAVADGCREVGYGDCSRSALMSKYFRYDYTSS